jgi:hypothetical protein
MKRNRSEMQSFTCRFDEAFLCRLDTVRTERPGNHLASIHPVRVIEWLAELGLREYMEMQRRLGPERAHVLLFDLVRRDKEVQDNWVGWSTEEAAANWAEQLRDHGIKIPPSSPRKALPRGPRVIPFPVRYAVHE